MFVVYAGEGDIVVGVVDKFGSWYNCQKMWMFEFGLDMEEGFDEKGVGPDP